LTSLDLRLTLLGVAFWRAAAAAVGAVVWTTLGGIGGTGAVAEAHPHRTSVTFDEPGVFQWRVPAGVRSATFDLYGAAGGGAQGGAGAHVTATIRVRPRTVLTIVVGGRGGDPTGGASGAGAGGFGGGAPGGAGADPLDFGDVLHLPGGPGGGGGGGASDVRTGDTTDFASRLLVAGGGGGSGSAAGGAGGADGVAGSDGQVVSSLPDIFPPTPVLGGGGGTAVAGGAGGEGGAAGGSGVGGAGQAAPITRVDFVSGNPFAVSAGQGGGGGGGGLFGGGGGGSAGRFERPLVQFTGTSAGGGGGSSLVPDDTLCPPLVEPGVSSGDGSVVVTFHRGPPHHHRRCSNV